MSFKTKIFCFSALAAIATVVSGCANSGGAEAVLRLDENVSMNAFVRNIEVTPPENEGSATFVTRVSEQLRRKFDACATGDEPVDVSVTVTEYRGANAAKTILIGDSTTVQATAKILDAETGEIIGDYDIAESTGGGGVLVATALSDVHGTVGWNVAGAICRSAFSNQHLRYRNN